MGKTAELDLEVPANSRALTKTQEMPMQLSPMNMIQKVIDSGVTSENVAVLEKMMDLYERLEAKSAEKQFTDALKALQADLPRITAQSEIKNRGKYQKFEHLMEHDGIAKLLTKHGFSMQFNQEFKDDRIGETCTLSHVGGHSRSNTFWVRTGAADNNTQADCKASTTAKRNAFRDALNLVIHQDCLTEEEDGGMESGSVITWEQAESLRQRVQDTKSDEPAFLRYAGAQKYEQISISRYADCDKLLKKKEGRA